MNKRVYILVFLSLFMRAQSQVESKSNNYRSNIEIDDLDFDNVSDTMYYNTEEKSIVFLLSSLDFEPISVRSDIFLINDQSVSFQLYLQEGKLYIGYSEMRFFENHEYTYDNEKKDLRYTHYSNQNLGPASNDGSGSFSLNVITGEFDGSWKHCKLGSDSFISIVVVDTIPPYPPIYFVDNSVDYDEISSDSIYLSYIDRYYTDYDIDDLNLRQIVNDANIKCIIDVDRERSNEFLLDKYSVNINKYLSDISLTKNCISDRNMILLYTTEKYSKYLFFSPSDVYRSFVILDIDKITLKTQIVYYFDYTGEKFNLKNIIENELQNVLN